MTGADDVDRYGDRQDEGAGGPRRRDGRHDIGGCPAARARLAHQVEGRVQGAVGTAADSIDDVADIVQSLVRRHPVGALVAVGAAAYLLGRVAGAIRRRR